MASTFTFPDFIGYPVSKVYDREYPRKPKPERPYYNMTLEEYPPYKALGPKPVLHGPAPYWPSLSGCGMYHIAENMCVCSMDCERKPLLAWARANPEAFNQKQQEMARWNRLWKLWCQQRDQIEAEWSTKTYWIRQTFNELQDKESPIGCVECEDSYRDYCNCHYSEDHGFDDSRRLLVIKNKTQDPQDPIVF